MGDFAFSDICDEGQKYAEEHQNYAEVEKEAGRVHHKAFEPLRALSKIL
jgi:hypothetical protein